MTIITIGIDLAKNIFAIPGREFEALVVDRRLGFTLTHNVYSA